MRLVSTDSLKDGIKLGKPVYNERGQILISDGVPLTGRMIQRLNEMGITYVYVQDPKTDDIQMKDPISETTRMEALDTIETTFHKLNTDSSFGRSFDFDKATKRFTNVVRSILSDLKNNQEAISMLSDVVVHDSYIFKHSLNVTIYSLALGMELNLKEKNLEEIGIGAMLHDVGKMMIPLKVLKKPGRLTDMEFEHIKMHAEHGFELLRNTATIPLTAAHCAFQHHERLDGSGYPRGIKGDEIHMYGKLIAIADVFDAVTSNRVYRNAMLPHDGLELLYSGVDQLFDRKMVDAFSRTVVLYPEGLTVHLSDGRRGVVVRQNKGFSSRPVIRILEEHSRELDSPYELDLSKQLSVMITECDATLSNDQMKFTQISQ